jgi:hypothetical protein
MGHVALQWKKAVLKYVLVDSPKKIWKIKGNSEGVLWYSRKFENSSKIKIISLRKAFELKDIPGKIWRTAKKIRYIPMYLRSKRDEIRHALKETCHFGPLKKDGDN